MSHVTRHSHASQCLLYINSLHRLYNITALDQLPLSSQLVPSTQQVSRSSSSSTYIGIASTVVRRTQGGSYVLKEMDGTVSARGIAAFRLIPYYSQHTPLPDSILSNDDESDDENANENGEKGYDSDDSS